MSLYQFCPQCTVSHLCIVSLIFCRTFGVESRLVFKPHQPLYSDYKKYPPPPPNLRPTLLEYIGMFNFREKPPSNESIQKRHAFFGGIIADIYISLSVESLQQFTDALQVQLHTSRPETQRKGNSTLKFMNFCWN